MHEHGVGYGIPSLLSLCVHSMVEEEWKCMLWHALLELSHQQIFDGVPISIARYEEKPVWPQSLGLAEQLLITVSYGVYRHCGSFLFGE